jgi:hypothetical protein
MTLRARTVAKANSAQRNQQALQHFLEDLMRDGRSSDEIELLAEILDSLRNAPRWTLPARRKVREGMTA